MKIQFGSMYKLAVQPIFRSTQTFSTTMQAFERSTPTNIHIPENASWIFDNSTQDDYWNQSTLPTEDRASYYLLMVTTTAIIVCHISDRRIIVAFILYTVS